MPKSPNHFHIGHRADAKKTLLLIFQWLEVPKADGYTFNIINQLVDLVWWNPES